MDNTKKILPKPTLKRLPLYFQVLKEYRKRNEKYISATQIAEALHLKSILVRKDLAATGFTGKPKIGYIVEPLIHHIEQFLQWNNTQDALLVGCGNLGKALLGYKGFNQYGLQIALAFDVDKQIVGTSIYGIEVFPVERLGELCKRLGIQIGIITVPPDYAQGICDLLVEAGIKAIWNFSPAILSVPDRVILQREDMAVSLAVLQKKLIEMTAVNNKNKK